MKKDIIAVTTGRGDPLGLIEAGLGILRQPQAVPFPCEPRIWIYARPFV